MTRNHTTMIGPKTMPIPAVPRRWTRKSSTRMTHVIGTTQLANDGEIPFKPSTALSTEMAGVTTPSP